MKYYVYIYLDRRIEGEFLYKIPYYSIVFNYQPFYVGIGKLRNRLYDHLSENNPTNHLKANKIKKIIQETGLNPIIVKLFDSLKGDRAKKIERQLILSIGRIDLGSGPLTNLTDGGDGTFGYRPSVKALKNWRESIKKFYSSVENRKKMGYYSTLDGMKERYGNIEGEKLYLDRIQRIKKSIRKAYKNPDLRERCKNRGKKNGMFGVTPPSAIKVIVNGKEYSSIYEASIKEGIPYTTLSQRLRSQNFPEYKILK